MALVTIAGYVIGVVEKTVRSNASTNGSSPRSYRVVHLMQKDESGTPEIVSLKTWDPEFEVSEGQETYFPCVARSWCVKTQDGSYKHGVDFTIISSKRG